MPYLETVQELLEAKEGEHVQFKEAKNRIDFGEAAKCCCALANNGGGKLVFGITDKWVDLFKDIRVEQPSWYVSSHAYTTGILLNSLTTQMTQASANAISAVNAQSLTTSSTGGFAGGGGGGGGGGGW